MADEVKKTTSGRIARKSSRKLTEALSADLSEPLLADKVDHDDKPFEYNRIGLTSDEAAERLVKYGLNQLPKSTSPSGRSS
jgi:hypothetical protein